jgi:hypothetical protein
MLRPYYPAVKIEQYIRTLSEYVAQCLGIGPTVVDWLILATSGSLTASPGTNSSS